MARRKRKAPVNGAPIPDLTAEASAMRAFTVLPLNQEDAGNVLRFFGAARLLEGSDWSDDDRALYAQALILKWVGRSIQGEEVQEKSAPAITLREAAHDAALLAYWLSSIQPIEGDSFERGDEISCGFHRISALIDNLLTAALGDTSGPEQDAEVAHG